MNSIPHRIPLLTALGVALAAIGCAAPRPVTPETAMAAMREMVKPTQLTPISYLRNGQALGPRLILVHGTPGEATGWADYVIDPPPGVDVVALDRPGFGKSGPDHAVTNLNDQAAAVLSVMSTDTRPVILLGHSLGGPVVATVAVQHPQRVAAIILLAAAMDPALEQIHPLQYVGAWAPIRSILPRHLRNANAELMALKPELERLAQDLHRITTKVVIVHGTRDRLVPVQNVSFMQQHLTGTPCVKTILLEGKDHFLPWNSQVEVRRAIDMAMELAC